MRLETLEKWLRFEVWPNFLDTFSRRGGFEGRTFYLQPLPFAAVQCASSLLPFLLLLLHGPAHLRFWVVGFFGFKITLGTFLAALVVSRYFPIILNERGLRARNLLGEARRVEWSQIRSVHFTRWFGIAPMLRVSTFRRANVIWLPLYLREKAEFEAYVRQIVPRGNPFREHFEPKP